MKEIKWLLHSEVVGFKAISGDHSSWNLGQYFVGLCDCVGICQPKASKVHGIWTLFDMMLISYVIPTALHHNTVLHPITL